MLYKTRSDIEKAIRENKINQKDENGITPLMWGCINADESLLGFLLGLGVYVNLRDNYGNTLNQTINLADL